MKKIINYYYIYVYVAISIFLESQAVVELCFVLMYPIEYSIIFKSDNDIPNNTYIYD